MTDTVFERLADALDRLPNGFPRTAANVEIRILKKIFTEEEAALASGFSAVPEPISEIARRFGVPEEEMKTRLVDMARRGLLKLSRKDGQMRFRLAPFIVGMYESQIEKMDHEYAHLIEEYMAAGGAEGIIKPYPALHRVVPGGRAVRPEWILPYDDIRSMLENSKSFRAEDCICRVQQDMWGHRRCDFPVRLCLNFSPAERKPSPHDISKDEALALLERAEEIGLVHCVSNVIEGVFYVCNCCGCCCGILRGITDWGIENSVARANYYAVIDPEVCNSCGICIERCQVKAIAEVDGAVAVRREKCIGCGLCVRGCSSSAVQLDRRPEAEFVDPPEDFSAWERLRSKDRGLTDGL
ncbi:MAG: 4Fe-4S binding protein [candidate division WOR-3 bacterium]|nr:MAG: 4Fe-4S binding protein [candidate division WOR-3 bacterium]